MFKIVLENHFTALEERQDENKNVINIKDLNNVLQRAVKQWQDRSKKTRTFKKQRIMEKCKLSKH